MNNRNPFGSETKAKEFCENNNIAYLGVFGSYARGQEAKNSDIDLLMNIDHSKGYFTLFDLVKLKNKLEKMFGKEVDIITKPNRHVVPYIEQDLVTIYGER